jgi:putative two-component system response regulator
VCDVYDALRTRRPYREAWSSVDAEAYLEQRAGIEFDPDLVATFLKVLRASETKTTT